LSFFSYCSAAHLLLHSFPTRRSSDLYRYWQRAMHGDPRAIGERLAIGPVDYTVVGVMPEGFNGVALDESHVYLPIHVAAAATQRSEEHTSELQSRENLVCRLLLEKKK